MLADSQGRGMIIWPIALKLFQSVMLQQRPRWTGGRRIPVGDQRNSGTRPTLPWDDGDRPPNINFGRYDRPPIAANTVDRNFALCATGVNRVNLSVISRPQAGTLGGQPAVIHALKPLPALQRRITGIATDSTLTPLANAIVNLFRVDRDSGNNKIYTHLGKTISDATGSYTFFVNTNSTYRVTADKSDLTTAGVSYDTLVGA